MESKIQVGLHLRGKLSGCGDICLEGALEGDIEIEGNLEVGPDAHIIAEVKADIIHVAGEIKGKVIARNKVKVFQTGCIDGDVIAPQITIETGGKITGEIAQTVSALPSNITPPPIRVPNLGRIRARYKST